MFASLLLAGCQSPLAYDSPSARSAKHDRLARLTHRAHSAPNAQTQPMRPATPPVPGGGPDQYVARAMQHNPAIRAAKRRIRRLDARLPQATSLDDPRFRIAPFGDMAETAAGQNGLMTSVSQTLPLPAKLRVRGRIAEHDVAMARQHLQQTRLRVAADVQRAYWNYYLAVRSIEVTKDNQRLLQQFAQTARAKYKAGTASQADVLRAANELSDLNNTLATLQQRKQTATAMLNRLMDRPVHRALPKPQAITFDKTAFQLNALLREARANNPELAQAREQVDQFRAKRKLANLNRWPDLTVSANYNAVQDEGLSPVADGHDAWWVGFGINLPIWQDKLDAAEQEAIEGRLEAAARLDNMHNTIAFRVQDALTRFRTQQQQVALFQNTILPQAEQTVKASMSSYRTGEADFLTVIDNWQKLLQFELAYHKAIAQLEKDLADLQQQIGHDLAGQGPSTKPGTHTQPTTILNAEPHHE
jgi:outer membrane protein TolC